MFDPTAYENMKVIIEGNLYDKDLSGDLQVIDRNEFINLAKLSRTYEISITYQNNKDIFMVLNLHANLQNLAAELLQAAKSEILAGCTILLKIHLYLQNDPTLYHKIQTMLEEIWGGRDIKQRISVDPFEKSNKVNNEITISFDRLVFEHQMDDLYDMMDYMIETLIQLNKEFFGKEE